MTLDSSLQAILDYFETVQPSNALHDHLTGLARFGQQQLRIAFCGIILVDDDEQIIDEGGFWQAGLMPKTLIERPFYNLLAAHNVVSSQFIEDAFRQALPAVERWQLLNSTIASPPKSVRGYVLLGFQANQQPDAAALHLYSRMIWQQLRIAWSEDQLQHQEQLRDKLIALIHKLNASDNVAQSSGMQDIFKLILDSALTLCNAKIGALFNYPEDSQYDTTVRPQPYQLRVIQSTTLEEPFYMADRGILRRFLDEDRTGPLNIGNVQAPPWEDIYVPTPGASNIRSELVVPLIDASGNRRGILNLESTYFDNFTRDVIETARLFADAAVAAIHSQENYRKRHRNENIERIMRHVNEHIIQQQSKLRDTMRFILKSALDLLESDLAHLYVYDYARRMQTRYKVQSGQDYPVPDKHTFGVNQEFPPTRETGIVYHVAQSCRPYLVNDVQSDPIYDPKDNELETASSVTIPILEDSPQNGKRVLGVLNIESQELYKYTDQDIESLQKLGKLIQTAISNARTVRQWDRLRDHLEALKQASSELQTKQPDEKEVTYRIIADTALSTLQCDHVLYRYFDEQRQSVIAHYPSGHEPRELKVGQGLAGAMARDYQTRPYILVADRDKLPPGVDHIAARDDRYRCLLALPVKTPRRLYGVLILYATEPFFFFEKEVDGSPSQDIQFAEWMVEELSKTLERIDTTRQEKERDVMAAIGQANYGLAHELNNRVGHIPMRVRSIKAEITGGDSIDMEHVTHYLNRILSSIADVSKLVERYRSLLLDKPETRKRSEFLVSKLLREGSGFLTDTDVELILAYPDDIGTVYIHETPVVIALHQLCNNAYAAMRRSPRKQLILRAVRQDKGVLLTVQDTGEGIAPEIKDKIFDFRFTTKKHGSGFGLWIARINIQNSGGRIWLEDTSEENGTTFCIWLPSAAEPETDTITNRQTKENNS
jgi:signal transduction histidine kinase/putative methionine-R-sulfoxide reductase with GAF domain